VVRFTLPEDLAALDELLLKGDAWPATRPVMTLALLLAGPPSEARLKLAFDVAVKAIPRMHQRVVRSPWATGRASWVNDEAFDLSFHLRGIGAPGDGTLDAALAWASSGTTAPFDPARPLWDAVLVEGLSDEQALVVIRAHHAIADGVRAIQMMAALLDLEPHPPSAPASPDVKTGRTLSPNATQWVRAVERAWLSNPRQARALVRSVSSAGLRPLHAVASSTAYIRSAVRTMDRGSAEPSPLLAGRSATRQFATLEAPLEAMKETARAYEVTVNDVYLTALLGGVRKYHQAFDLPAKDVPLALPIDVGGESQHDAGNHISAAIIPGPASIADPIARLRAVHELVSSRRAEPGLRALDHLAPTLRQVPARLAIAAMGAHARRVDVQASNLIGPPCPLYLAGEQIRRMYAFGPLPGVPAMAVLVSYDGVCTVGLTLDPAAVTDAGLFVECIQAAMAELLDRNDAH